MATDVQLGPRDLTLNSADGLPLRAWAWGQERPRGVLIISHGLGEHAGCYGHVAEHLGPALGIDVVAFDYRGHGRSPGRRGVVRSYAELLGDLRGVLDWAGRAYPGRPRFVLGHSNGGQVALRLLLEPEPTIAGAILSNPSLSLAVAVPRWKMGVGQVLRRLAPGVTLNAALADAQMTNDPDNLATRRDDRLRHTRISAPLFFGMIEGGAALGRRVEQIVAPILLLLGGKDPVVDAAVTRAAFDRLGSPDKTLRVYPEMLHEPLNDLDRRRVLDDIIAWLGDRLPAAP